MTDPTYTLTKKHNAITYHNVRESVTAEEQRITHGPGSYNVADMLTKLLPGPKLKACCEHFILILAKSIPSNASFKKMGTEEFSCQLTAPTLFNAHYCTPNMNNPMYSTIAPLVVRIIIYASSI